MPAVRAMMALRANVLARGHSGIRLETLELLLAMLNAAVHPVVPSRGSVGASGDLAPLAHLALVLIGEGEVLTASGREPGAAGAGAGRPGAGAPGAQGRTGAHQRHAGLDRRARAGAGAAERLARAADIVAAMSIDALRGSTRPFDARIHDARPHAGPGGSRPPTSRGCSADSAINAVARQLRARAGRVLGALRALRCTARAATRWRFIASTVEIEANASTDNPMVFAETGDIVSGGNFHGAPVGLAADLLAAAVTHVATISERRAERLVNPALSDLPAFLTRHGGLESGLMLAQVTAAALASELKALAHPVVGRHDPDVGEQGRPRQHEHGGGAQGRRAPWSWRRWSSRWSCCARARRSTCWRRSRRRRRSRRCTRMVRTRVARRDGDRPPSPDIEAIAAMIAAGALDHIVGPLVN